MINMMGHGLIALVVSAFLPVILLLLAFSVMSGRRFTLATFVRTSTRLFEHLLQSLVHVCGQAASSMAGSLPATQAQWRPAVRIAVQIALICLIIGGILAYLGL